MSKYDFALQWLDYLGIKVYNKGKRILQYFGEPEYDISPLNTKIRLGEDFIEDDEEEEYTRMAFQEFQKLGYIVIAENNPKYFWKPRQQKYYRVVRKAKNRFGITYDNFRQQRLTLQHDASNRRFRLIGENVLAPDNLRVDAGVSDWIVYDEDAPRVFVARKKKNLGRDEIRAMMKQKMYGNTSYASEEFQSIEEVPMIISDEKYIVCMKKMDTCQRMIVVGESGFGKSTAVNAISNRIFYKWEDRQAWLIDPLNQLHDISAPQEYNSFNKFNELLNDTPKPIPALQLHLACRNPLKIKHPNISLTVNINFVEFLRKYQFYTYGVKEWDLGNTRRYLLDFINEIKDITKVSDLTDTMFDKIPNARKDKGMQAMIYKWQNTFETFFADKFTSNMYQNDEMATNELEVEFPDGKRIKGHPFIMAYQAGLIPVLNIAAARRQRWLRNYLADLMQKIVQFQMEQDNQKRIWVIADELNEIYEVGKRKDKASECFEELYRQGRINNIGFIGNTQSLDKLNPEMYKNATHICCVYIKDPKERKKIGDTFNLSKETYNLIEGLKKQEMMIFSKEPFIIYDRWGRRKEVTDRKWFKGKIIPPINFHKAPGGK